MSSVNQTCDALHDRYQRSGEAFLEESPALAHLASLLPVMELSAADDSNSSEPDDSDQFQVLDKIARMLFRSKRGHVLLCGSSGIGKTTAIRAFARQVGRGRFPFLAGCRVLHIDVSNVGPEDSRACLESIFAAVGDLPRLILCLDGLACLMKRSHGGSNKPLLRCLMKKTHLKVLGTMTTWEYAEHIGADAQMLQMFSRLELQEPAGAELHEIVSNTAASLAEEFRVEISDDIVHRTIALASTFLLSEAQPAKSIDVLRHVCEDICYGRSRNRGLPATLTADAVVQAIAERTGIPPETINGQGRECDFRRALADAVLGQDHAIEEVATELQLISAGLAEPGKPASVMMFAGLTGVGKTELAKRIAELYSASRRLQVYSMGNFTEPHSVSGVIGVPPGYVGHEEGGRLINELRADPYSVFLLDEAEKCHPNVWKPFLNLFDEGWIVDQRGVKAYADRAIFILTTNAGDKNISQLVRSGKSTQEIVQNVKLALSRARQERSSQPVFPPQFLSRIKRIVAFNPLDEPTMVGIARLVGQRLMRRWQTARGKSVFLAPDLIQRIGARAHALNEKANGQEGGRIVQKLFSDHVEHAIYRRSLEDRDGYERCGEIAVSLLTAGDDEVAVPVDVSFARSCF